MFRLLIVDDEVLVRIGIKSCIKWHEIGFEEPFEASNGREALGIIKDSKIDVILTDIRMPDMDGLELIKNISQGPDRPEVVILSCYNEFEYVREAMLYGARDFLFKPKMYPNDIIAALGKSIEHLEERKKINEKIFALQKKNDEDCAWKKESFLLELIEGKKISNNEFSLNSRELGIKLDPGNLAIIFIRIGNFVDVSMEKFGKEHYRLKATIKDMIIDSMDNKNYCEIVCKSLNEYVLFYTNPNEKSEYKVYLDSMECGKKILKLLKDNLSLDVSGGLSRTYNDIQWVFNAYNEAVLAENRSVLKGYGYMVWFDEENDSSEIKLDEMIEILDNVYSPTGHEYLDNLKSVFLKIESANFHNLDVIREIGSNIVNRLFRNYQNYPQVLYEIYKKFPMTYQTIYKMNSIIEIEKYLTDLATQLNRIIENQFRIDIMHATEYIKDHMSDPDLGLEAVARHVNLSKNYFSRLFKETTGENFTDYVIRVRLEYGRELYLSSDMKIYEIAEKVGYPNWRYFTRLYKQKTGNHLTSCKK